MCARVCTVYRCSTNNEERHAVGGEERGGTGAAVSSIPKGTGVGSLNYEIDSRLSLAPVWAAQVQARVDARGQPVSLLRRYHADDAACYL